MAKALDEQIDRLYQLPLDEFTAARNALAKDAGKDGDAIRALTKPPLAAWAVNQLYWNRRDEYESLVGAAERMRKTHRAVIEGRRGDLRSAGREHELAVESALKAAVELLQQRGQPVTEATRHAVLNTLRALPSEDPPGRLSRALTPGGFEMLAGVMPKASAARPRPPAPGKRGAATAGGDAAAKSTREDARRRAEREAAERALRDAEHRARRAEFETARAARDVTKAEKRLAEAREALERAREEAADAERAAAAAARASEAAERKARDAESALETAKRAVADT